MAATNRFEARHAAGGGAVAGLVGGIAISILLLVSTVAHGQDIWPAFKGAAYPFLGDAVMAPGFDAGPVLLGTLIHYAISAGWGLAFGLIFYGLSRVATVGMGVLWGVVVWLGMYYVVLPIVGMGFVAEATPIAVAAINHIVFGVAVALAFLPYQRARHLVVPRVDRGAPIMP